MTQEGTLLGGRDASGRLIVRMTPQLGKSLMAGTDYDGGLPDSARYSTYTLRGGTTIESGTLKVIANTLVSDIWILLPGTYTENDRTAYKAAFVASGWSIEAAVVGNIDNAGHLGMTKAKLTGNVVNRGYVYAEDVEVMGAVRNEGHILVGSAAYWPSRVRIGGDFSQSAEGTLDIALPLAAGVLYNDADYVYPLLVGGKAHLAGTLTLRQGVDSGGGGWGPDIFPLPTKPISFLVLSADGGVFGTFDKWTSPGLLIEGALRYGTNDVWFDLQRASAAATLTANGIGSATTLASAGNLDLALGAIDGFGSVPPPGFSSRFLRSANRLLWTADAGNFVRTLDSLAAPLHTQAMGDALRAGQLPVAASAHLARMQPGKPGGLWSAATGDGTAAGQDAWLSPRLLVGSSVAQSFGQSAGDFGQATRRSPQAALYLRWFGDDGWYAGGSAGYARQDLALGRMLHLGDMQSTAHARRSFDSLGLQGEAGRSFDVAGGRLSPYAGMALASVRGSRMQELGSTGFELALAPAMQSALDGQLGARFSRDWRFGDGWLQLDADARWQQRLATAGDAQRAAFLGLPDLWFDLPGQAPRSAGWLDLGLRGGFSRDWNWSLDYRQGFGRDDSRQAFIQLRRAL